MTDTPQESQDQFRDLGFGSVVASKSSVRLLNRDGTGVCTLFATCYEDFVQQERDRVNRTKSFGTPCSRTSSNNTTADRSRPT